MSETFTLWDLCYSFDVFLVLLLISVLTPGESIPKNCQWRGKHKWEMQRKSLGNSFGCLVWDLLEGKSSSWNFLLHWFMKLKKQFFFHTWSWISTGLHLILYKLKLEELLLMYRRRWIVQLKRRMRDIIVWSQKSHGDLLDVGGIKTWKN